MWNQILTPVYICHSLYLSENKKDETTNKTDTPKKDNTVKTGDETDASVFALSAMSSMVLATILYSINKRRKILN